MKVKVRKDLSVAMYIFIQKNRLFVSCFKLSQI